MNYLRMKLKALLMNKIPLLPNAYQQVEYIESTGTDYITSYIDTGVLAGSNIDIDIDFKVTGLKRGNCIVFGGEDAWINKSYDYQAVGTYQGVGRGIVYGNSCYTSTTIKDYSKKYNITIKNGNFYINNQLIDKNNSTFQSSTTIALFGINRNKKTIETYLMQIYKCKMWENGVLVRDFIPCYRRKDNVVGLFDLVNEKFYVNAGTCELIKGSEI